MITKLQKIVRSEDGKRLLSNFLSLSALQAVTFILPLFTLPYLVRVLGVERYGLVMFSQSFVAYFAIVVDYGFNLSATRQISIHRDDAEKLTEIYSAVMTIKVLLVGLSFLVLLLLLALVKKLDNCGTVSILTFGTVIGQALFPTWYFQGIERMKYITIVNVVAKAAFTFLIFFVVRCQQDYLLVPVVNSAGMIIGSLLSLRIIHKQFQQRFRLQSFGTLLSYFQESTHFFLSRISVSLYTTSNAFALGIFTNTTLVGYYSIAETLYKGLQSLYNPVIAALYPYVAKERKIATFKRIFKFAAVMNMMLVVLLALSAGLLFRLLFHQNYTISSIHIFYILLLASLIVVPSIIIGYPFLGALGYTKEANTSVIAGSIVHIIGLGLLIIMNVLTIYSVASMVVLTESVILILRIYSIRKHELWQLA